MVLSVKGANAGTEVIVLLRRETREELLGVLSVWTGAGAGTPEPCSVACRIVSASRLASVTPTSASG